MDIVILAVGRLRPYYREACDDYLGRLDRYARVDEREIRETSKGPSAAGQERDAAALLERVPPGSRLVALTRHGSAWSSRDLAQRLEQWRAGARGLAFAIGGSHGLGTRVLERADAQWSLGPLTLPHELARVVVLEQLYRAFTMLEGHPYHKGREKRKVKSKK
jgi:23S rRNA (pseudouridine1915-N3)-methyltransferase